MRPRPPLFASFRGRILVGFIGLIAVSQLATMAAVLAATRRNVAEQQQESLIVGGRVFQQLLLAREIELVNSVTVLTADFGFREAVATGDEPTIQSALENHGGRIDASLVVLIGLDGNVVAVSAGSVSASALAEGQPAPAPFDELIARAELDGQAAATGMFAGEPFQLVLVPVRAPTRIAWVAMGFAVDDQLARAFERITNLDVSFWGAGPGAPAAILASTLESDARDPVARAVATRIGDERPFLLEETAQLTLSLPLDPDPAHPLMAVLQSSLAEALAPWHALRAQLLVLTAASIPISAVAAVALGRHVTHPVQTLVAGARRILGGRYDEPVDVRSRDELGLLARTFNEMQRGIAEREQRIVQQAHHDPLTGLPNRVLVRERLAGALDRAHARGVAVSLLMIDLDGFKAVNDGFGYEAGDRVLRSCAEGLIRHAPAGALVARLGSDEFLVILEGACLGQAVAAAERLAIALGAPLALDDARLELSFHIGVAAFPEHGDDAGMLLRRADIALQDARALPVPILVYEDGRDERYLRRLGLARDLRVAIAAGDLAVWFQPKLELATGDLMQAEALVRWTHRERGPIGSDEFIPLAEQAGLIGDLTQWVLGAVIGQWRAWTDTGLSLGLSVNLSALDLIREEFPTLLRDLLHEHAMPPQALILEITESAVMRDPAASIAMLERLRASGLRIAIDDFGTGHSSLAQLRHMPVDELKIDKSFLRKLERGSEDGAIVRSIIDLGHHLGLQVVAEGVEDEAVLEFLRETGCDLVQGYHVSRPLPAADFEVFVRRSAERAS